MKGEGGMNQVADFCVRIESQHGRRREQHEEQEGLCQHKPYPEPFRNSFELYREPCRNVDIVNSGDARLLGQHQSTT